MEVVPIISAALNLWILSKLYELTAKLNRLPCEKDARRCPEETHDNEGIAL